MSVHWGMATNAADTITPYECPMCDAPLKLYEWLAHVRACMRIEVGLADPPMSPVAGEMTFREWCEKHPKPGPETASPHTPFPPSRP